MTLVLASLWSASALLTLLLVGVVGGVVVTVLRVASDSLESAALAALMRRAEFERRYRRHAPSLKLALIPGAVGALAACLSFRGWSDGRSDNDQATAVAAVIALGLGMVTVVAVATWWIWTGNAAPRRDEAGSAHDLRDPAEGSPHSHTATE